MQIGQFRLSVVSDGEFRLDGGAMFGVIPKVMWSPVKWCDERNRIRMATNCLLIEAGSDLVLIDTGKGDKQDAKFEELYGYQPGPSLPDAIRKWPDRIPAADQQYGEFVGISTEFRTCLLFVH